MARRNDSETLAAERASVADATRSTSWAPAQFRRRALRERSPDSPSLIDAPSAPWTAPRTWPSAYLLTFIAFVAIPAIAVTLYFALIASDQFAVESRFAVSATRNDVMSEKLKSSASANGYSSASQDAYIVSEYIKSRAMIDELSKTIDLKAIYTRPEADFWARANPKATAEEFASYWRTKVEAYVDGPSGIVTVTVRAFRREDALVVSKAIVAASEVLINSISARARADEMKLAENEVGSAEERVVSSLEDLRAFRDQSGFIDPTAQATSNGSILTELISRRIKFQGEYFVASRAMSPEAPTLQSMKARLESLDRAIADEKAKLTSVGDGQKSLASLIPKFEQLELHNRFAEKIYTLAGEGLERARLRAEAQSIYVTVFVPPALPQEAKFPERIQLSLVIAIGLCVLWGIGALTGAVIEDHRV
jgi:capsular polysaccharide transport system permease protein